MAKTEKKKSHSTAASLSERFARHFDELRWLYMELYDNSSMFAELCDNMERFYTERSADLKRMDKKREADTDWYRKTICLA